MSSTDDSSNHSDTLSVEIRVLPSELMLKAAHGQTYLDVLRKNGVDIATDCGGTGTCGKCKIQFVTPPPDPSPADRQHIDPDDVVSGCRLACAHQVTGPATVEIGDGRRNEGDPHRNAQRGDRHDDLPRRGGAVANSNAVEGNGRTPAGGRTDRSASGRGIVIDIGTTTLTVALFDLASRERLRTAVIRNPQRMYGADVISRIAYVRREAEAGLQQLHLSVTSAINELIVQLSESVSMSAESIRRAVVVGNPTMLHLFLGVSPVGIDVSPFVPAFTGAVQSDAESLALAVHPQAVVETLPAVSAYVGADIIAGLLATRFGDGPASALFLDVGTNGEIVLAGGEHLFACSTAAGPAFEGASVVQGMLASPGAIESVRVHDGGVTCGVIGDVTATGICGTGLLSAVSQLLRVGLIDPSGRFQREGLTLDTRFEGKGREARFRLTDGATPVYLYQRDVRELQLAKAALRAGIELILSDADVAADDLLEVLVAGAFSSGLMGDDLVETGLLPPVAATRIRGVGNAAVRGAAHVLLDEAKAATAKELVERVEYVELSGNRGFSQLYPRCMSFRRIP